MRCVSTASKSSAIRPIRRWFKRRVVGLERSFAKVNSSSNRSGAQKVDDAPASVLAPWRRNGRLAPTAHLRGRRICGLASVANEILTRAVGHKPLKLLSGLTNPIITRKPEVQ